MSEIKQKIITVDAKAFFKYFPKEIAENQKCFTLKYTNRALYKLVVQQENETEDCPLFHQFFKEIEKSWNLRTNDEPFRITNTTLFDKFVIVDFGDIFLPLDEISSFPGQKERHEDYLENAKDIVENGCDIYFKNHEKPVHMIAFDKSGNMSRHSRISFIDENYYAGLNTRLNLGMDFSKIPVKESKYYSYRGLSLSSSKRINHKKLIIDANTIVVLHDVRKDEKNPSKPITGYYYDKGITIATAKLDVEEDGSKEKINCTFLKTKREELLEVDIPFDGAGFISPEYASYINEALGTTGATSFQIRLPFMKGMLHEVDVHQFLEEYNIHKDGKENWYKDVFGKMRDLSKAHIFITESMFKGMKWLIKHLSNLEDKGYVKAYEDNLSKEMPRIPMLDKFMDYVEVGKELADLHVNYERCIDPAEIGLIIDAVKPDYTVSKMKFKKQGKSVCRDTIIYNEYITISNIPERAYEYVINGKSAIEWIVEKYAVTVEKVSGIVDDPNIYQSSKYIFDLLISVIGVSLKTQDLIDRLPEYKEI